MVAAAVIPPERQGRWLYYAAFSLLANALVLAAFNPLPVPREIPAPTVLKLRLKTLAAPEPRPVAPPRPEPVIEAAVLPPPVAVHPKVITDAQAIKKIAQIQQATEPAPEPPVQKPKEETRSEKPVKPLPLPPTRRLETPRTEPARNTPKVPSVSPPIQQAVAAPAPDTGRQTSTTSVHEADYRRRVPPVYPRRALDLGQEGVVVLHAEVTPTGRPRNLKVANSSGHRLLDAAALAAVRKWEFEPRREDGAVITSWVRVPVRFVIKH